MQLKIFPFLTVLLALCVLAIGNLMPMTKAGKDEEEICKEKACGRTFVNATMQRMSCTVQCTYCEEVKNYSLPDDRLCCDYVGVGPTGKCQKGKCQTMGNQCLKSKTK